MPALELVCVSQPSSVKGLSYAAVPVRTRILFVQSLTGLKCASSAKQTLTAIRSTRHAIVLVSPCMRATSPTNRCMTEGGACMQTCKTDNDCPPSSDGGELYCDTVGEICYDSSGK